MDKNKSLVLIFFLTTIFCYSQKDQCLSDEYLKTYKQNNPELEQTIKDFIFNLSHDSEGIKVEQRVEESDQILTIPVVFNIIHYGESEGTGRNLSLDKINEQITIMNEAYSGMYGGVDTKIRFCLARQNSLGTATTGVNRFFGQPQYDMGTPVPYFPGICAFNSGMDNSIKGYNGVGFPNTLFLNIWTTDLRYCEGDNLLGYSSFPYYLSEIEQFNDVRDGVVIDYRYIGTNGVTSSAGMTIVHEVGHWLGIFHVFEDNDNIVCNSTPASCDQEEDLICDTDSVEEWGLTNIAPGDCLGYNCAGQTTTIVQNFMDYQNPPRFYCQKSFTADQKQRMRDIMATYRVAIYNQANSEVASCNIPSPYPGGSAGGGCSAPYHLGSQYIARPASLIQDLSQYFGSHSYFGERIEVSDKWLVTIDRTWASFIPPMPSTAVISSLVIYRREGCQYALHQTIPIPLSSVSINIRDFSLTLIDNEIIVSSTVTDAVYIYHYNSSTNIWTLAQQLVNSSTSSEMASNAFTVNNFLFIFERQINPNGTLNLAINAVLRVYFKNASGVYVFHQTIAVSGFNMPSLESNLLAGNYKKAIVNINSSTYVGSYDPPEILVSKSTSGIGFLLLELNTNNIWTASAVPQPIGMGTNERLVDMELSKDFIHVLTSKQTGPQGSAHDILYLYAYRITPNSGNPFSATYNKQELYNSTNNIYSDIKLRVYNDQFLFIDNIKNFPLRFYQNLTFGTTFLPNWQFKTSFIYCGNPGAANDDFEVYGNFLFYGYNGINIFRMQDVLTKAGFTEPTISSTDFFDKKICTVPSTYSIQSQNITIGPCYLDFNNAQNEFIANNSISVKPGVSIYSGSQVTLKIANPSNACNIIISRMGNNDNSDGNINDEQLQNSYTNDNSFKMYPNPTNSIVTITTKDYYMSNISIISIDGKQVYFEKLKGIDLLQIDISNFSKGIYIVSIETNKGEKISKKLIKE